MAEPSARLQQQGREKVTYRRRGRSRRCLKSEEEKRCPLAPPAAAAGGRGRSCWPAGRPQVPAPVRQALGMLVSGRRGPSVPRSWLAWPGPRPPRHPEAGLPGAKWRWGRPGCQPRRTRKMLLLSPALIWHWLPGEGGPEAAAAARPRPPGIFERCSWVLAGWPTWPRRAARPPNPPPRGGGGASRGGTEGGGRSLRPLSGRPRRTPGVRPGPGPARRQPAPWPGSRAPAPCWGGRPGRAAQGVQAARLLGIRGHIVPTWALQRSRRRPAPGCAPSRLPRGEGGAPPQQQTSEGARPDRRPRGCAVATQSSGCGSGPALCLTDHLTLRKPPRLSQPQFPHLCEGQGEWLPARAAVMIMKSAYAVLSPPPPALGPRGAARRPGSHPGSRHVATASQTTTNPQCHQSQSPPPQEGRWPCHVPALGP